MGPRLKSRGKDARPRQIERQGAASMGPRLKSRGKGEGHGLVAQHLTLQWGRG